MSIIFRSADQKNKDEIIFIASTDAKIPLDYDNDYFYEPAFLESRVKFFHEIKEEDFFEVASHQDKIVAFHVVQKTPFFGNLEIASVITLWVDPDYRRQGIATELKKRGERWAIKAGLEHIQTSVHESNTTMLELNQDQGYEAVQIKLRKKLKT